MRCGERRSFAGDMEFSMEQVWRPEATAPCITIGRVDVCCGTSYQGYNENIKNMTELRKAGSRQVQGAASVIAYFRC